MDHIAHVHQPEPDPTADGSGDVAVGQLQPGVIDEPLVHFNGPLILANRRGEIVDLLLSNQLLREQLLVACQVNLRVLKQGHITGHLALRLF